MKTYQNHAMTDAEARQALADACRQVETNLPLYTYQCQNHSSVNDIYPGCANNQWTCGFWPGEIWLAYEATGEEKFKTAALIQVDSFADRIARKVEVDHHDMGFLYSPTCVAAWKLVGSEKGKNAAIAAADQLLTRYQPSGRFLQAWGTMDDPGNYRYIIDCMLNVPLLYWAAQVTGSDHYREIAAAHTATTLANSFRPDGSTYHTFFMNPDGTPKGGRTCQGYKDDSFWARGQAWGVYGSAIGYTYTHDEKFLDVFRKALAFYLSRLPEDMIPCWDMLFAPSPAEGRRTAYPDCSAAAHSQRGCESSPHKLPRPAPPLPRGRHRFQWSGPAPAVLSPGKTRYSCGRCGWACRPGAAACRRRPTRCGCFPCLRRSG